MSDAPSDSLGTAGLGTAGLGRGAATSWSLSFWQQLREAAVPVIAYWVLLLFSFATFASVVLGTDGPGLDNLMGIGFCAVATFPGVILGQVLAFARVRSWVLLVFGAFCWAIGIGAAVALSSAFGEVGAFIALFFFVLPIALTGGLWSLETHRAVWSTWLPFLYTIAAVIGWAESQGKDAEWFAGNKWAIWDLLSIAVLGLTIVLVLVYLLTRETHRLALWRRGPRAPLAPSLVEKGAARPRLTPVGGCAVLLLAGLLTVATAVVSPYLWRSAPGDRQGEPTEAPTEQPSEPPPPQEGCDRESNPGPTEAPPEAPSEQDGEEMMEKVVRAVEEATGTLCSLLTLALLAILGVLIGGPPIRRLAVVRHLREPLWRVPPTTRIEQGWRLVEIALGDAGMRVLPGEDAQGLARRARPVLEKLSPVEVHGLEDAAEVADRVRFGLGVTAKDVATMDRFAGWAYDTVWERLSEGEQIRCMYRPL